MPVHGTEHSKTGQPRVKAILLMGQSNAVGVALSSTLTDSSYATPFAAVPYMHKTAGNTDPPVYTTYGNGPLEPKVYDSGTRMGIELSMGRALNAARPGEWAIIKFALSSTSLNANWPPNGTYPTTPPILFAQMITYTQACLATLGAELAAVIWIQGENDAGGSGTAAAYSANLQAFVDAMRAQLGTVPFIYGRINIDHNAAFRDTLRTQQAAFASTRPQVRMIDQDVVDLSGDLNHYTADGYVTLGAIYAQAVLAYT